MLLKAFEIPADPSLFWGVIIALSLNEEVKK